MAVTKSPPKRAPSKAAGGRRPKTDLSKIMARGVEVLVFGARRREGRTRRKGRTRRRNGPGDGGLEAVLRTLAERYSVLLISGAKGPTREEADGGSAQHGAVPPALPAAQRRLQLVRRRKPTRAASADLDDPSRDSGEGSTSDESSPSIGRREGRPPSPRERRAPRKSSCDVIGNAGAEDDVADVIKAIAEPSEANWTATEEAVRDAAMRKAAAAEERRATAARMRAPRAASPPPGAPETLVSAEQVYADAKANRPHRSRRRDPPAVVSRQPIPYRCGARLPEPPRSGQTYWEPCCLIHQSWYDPHADFIRTFGLSNFKAGDKVVRKHWYDCCRLCGGASARRYGCRATYCHPGGGTFEFQFCDERCRDDFFVRLDAARARAAVAARDGGACWKCRDRTGRWKVGRVRSVAEGGGCCGLENWKTLCEVCFRTW